MKVKNVIEFTEEEKKKIIDVLQILSEICDDSNTPDNLNTRATETFDNLAKILWLDESGERLFYESGW